jgi:hypothetical protein
MFTPVIQDTTISRANTQELRKAFCESIMVHQRFCHRMQALPDPGSVKICEMRGKKSHRETVI